MKYLTRKDMAREWAFGHDVCKMRQKFRALIELDPEAFATCVREYMEYGEERFPEIKTTGGRLATPQHSLAALLAEYQIAQERGVTKDEFLRIQSEKGIKSAGQYSMTSWQSESTINDKLKQARQLAKDDAEFQSKVQFYKEGFKDLEVIKGRK